MAKKDLLAELAALGIELTDEQQKKVEQHKESVMRDAAAEIIGRKLSNNNKSARDSWVKKAFSLASEMVESFDSNKVGRGRGEVLERVFRIETPHGSLKVSLSESTDESDE